MPWPRQRSRLTEAAAAALAGLLALPLGGCGGASAGDEQDRPAVVAAFYPLQFVAERLAGDGFEVSTLTEPGVEPHDLELTPGALREVAGADLVVYLGGFQPAVDEAVDEAAEGHALDVGRAADLVRRGDEPDGPADAAGRDPHFWLDPLRLAAVGDGVADRLAELEPAQAAQIRRNAARLRADLTALDRELRTGLATCADRDLVTAHEAFGYLAARYHLRQVGIAGINPDQEPSPADLAELTDLVRREHVRTVFTETLASPAVARTVARSAGARTAVLDPVEGLTGESPGDDYLSVMRANLRALRDGLGCR